MQVDRKAEVMSELHSQADRTAARGMEAAEQARRVSEDHPHAVAPKLKDEIIAAHH